ncbi:hypothetical protein BDN72DRAFT_902063 [Pluteus cervinus]|uniref:Uncharacterized protein n=1 Tax=Pluteus cervinus TaxID=181527 RepID=A0ACD3ADW8_9AGAR|nr:hypothetical protein BDN72DRAFT_902063 [Pluteus cervinus]
METKQKKASRRSYPAKCQYNACPRIIKNVNQWNRHKDAHGLKKFKCENCWGRFDRPDPCTRHMKNCEKQPPQSMIETGLPPSAGYSIVGPWTLLDAIRDHPDFDKALREAEELGITIPTGNNPQELLNGRYAHAWWELNRRKASKSADEKTNHEEEDPEDVEIKPLVEEPVDSQEERSLSHPRGSPKSNSDGEDQQSLEIIEDEAEVTSRFSFSGLVLGGGTTLEDDTTIEVTKVPTMMGISPHQLPR